MEPSARIALLEQQVRLLEERVEQLEEALGLTIEPSVALGLTSYEARLFGLLMARERCTCEQMMLALSALKPDGDAPATPVIKVHICRARKKLARFGVRIETLRGQGYRLAPADKERARQLLASR